MFHKRFHRLSKGIAVAALAALLVPLVTTHAQSTPKVLHYWASAEPKALDPQVVSYAESAAYDRAIWATLLRYDKNNQPSPWIAKEVPTTANGGISADGKTYKFKLRNDFKWSDGNGVVKAQDMVYAWQRVVDPKTASGYGSFFNGLIVNADKINNAEEKDLTKLGVKADDDFTLEFDLVHPAGYFNSIACMWLSAPVRKDNVERAGLPSPDAWVDPANGPVVGTGPYILTKWDHNKQMVFTKNPNYSGTPAKIDEIDLALIQDAAVGFAGYKAGELDISGLPAAEYKNIAADATLGPQLLKYQQADAWWFQMDNTKPPFNKKEVRQAFSYAIDRDQYIKVIANSLVTKWLSFLPPSIPGNDPSIGKEFDFNPDKAKAALAAAGYPDGKGFPAVNFNYVAGTNNQRRADYLKAQFKQILNIDITENPMDSAVYENATTDPVNKLDGFELAGWGADYLHPSDWLYPVFGSNGKIGNANNGSGYASVKFDAAAQAADNELDNTTALKKYQDAQKILVADVPVVFMYTSQTVLLVSPKVNRDSLNPNGLDGAVPGSTFWEEIDLK